MFPINNVELLALGVTVAALGLFAKKKLSPPSLDDVKVHLNKADEQYQKHLESKTSAVVAASAHVEAKKQQIDGLSSAIAEAQSSIDAAKSLTANL
jgi:hypothetical protein